MMSVLSKIAFYRGIRDEIPNQELARELAATKDIAGIEEIAQHLWDKNDNVRSDCLKVLYETGYISPELISPYTSEFLKLLTSKQNRLVWGAMIALSTVAPLKSELLFENRALMCKTIDQGSVITQDGGIKSLSLVAATNPEYQKVLTPFLMSFLKKCRPSDVPRHAEFISVCVNESTKSEFVALLNERLSDLTNTQTTRVKKLLKRYQ